MKKNKKAAIQKIDKIISSIEGQDFNPDSFLKSIDRFIKNTFKSSEHFYIDSFKNIEFNILGKSATQEAIDDKFKEGYDKTKKELFALRTKILNGEIELNDVMSNNIFHSLTNLQLVYLAITIIPIIFYAGYYYKELKYDKEKFEIQKELISKQKENSILKYKVDSLISFIKTNNLSKNTLLPTKNIVHLADSTRYENDSNK